MYDICPKNWHLPSGGTSTSSDFSKLNTAIGGYEGWQSVGVFRATLSGYWYGFFDVQGSESSLWSRTSYATDVRRAFNANFGPTFAYPDALGNRYDGVGVRCLLSQS